MEKENGQIYRAVSDHYEDSQFGMLFFCEEGELFRELENGDFKGDIHGTQWKEPSDNYELTTEKEVEVTGEFKCKRCNSNRRFYYNNLSNIYMSIDEAKTKLKNEICFDCLEQEKENPTS